MFDTLRTQPKDSLLALIGLYDADLRPDKVDLGVGVYRDEAGRTPIFKAVKAAERNIWEYQDSKSYVAPEGDQAFLDLLWALIGGSMSSVCASGIQTPGGSGALRVAADLTKQFGTGRIWLGLPSWPNHAGIFSAAGLSIATYEYFDIPSQCVLFDKMMSALAEAQRGDSVLLHAGCHNPTGASLSAEQWRELVDIIAARGLIPLIDLAYQGFGSGLVQDVAGLRTMVESVPETFVAVSSSKSFGLYRERTGAIYAVAASLSAAKAAQSNLVAIARTNYSMPPDHGAAIVRTILGTPELYRDWADELETMRQRLVSLRRSLAKALASKWSNAAAIAGQEGMFSLLPLSEIEVLTLRSEHGIYMPTSGRINIAGLKQADAERVAGIFTSL